MKNVEQTARVQRTANTPIRNTDGGKLLRFKLNQLQITSTHEDGYNEI